MQRVKCSEISICSIVVLEESKLKVYMVKEDGTIDILIIEKNVKKFLDFLGLSQYKFNNFKEELINPSVNCELVSCIMQDNLNSYTDFAIIKEDKAYMLEGGNICQKPYVEKAVKELIKSELEAEIVNLNELIQKYNQDIKDTEKFCL